MTDMRSRLSKLSITAVAAVLSLILLSAQTQDETRDRIRAAIQKVRSMTTVESRRRAVVQLERIVDQSVIRGRVPLQSQIEEMAALMDSPDEFVRYWVALALGDIGPPAKSVAPKLESMLPEADCINGVITSADAIRKALTQIGVIPPPRKKCPGRIAG